MMMKPMGRTAQGEALPKFSRTGLPDTVRHGTIFPVVTLSKWRRGWRIKHPQAVTKPRTIRTSSPVSGSLPGIYPVLGAWVGSQRKRPHCAFLGLALLCGYPIRLGLSKPRIHTMIFTFLIASSACRLADLRRIRTVTAVADTEAQARIALAGLPLVFLSRTPTGRAAA
ncbi:hypothetical protein IIDPJIOB_02215 [Aeromonas veronii]